MLRKEILKAVSLQGTSEEVYMGQLKTLMNKCKYSILTGVFDNFIKDYNQLIEPRTYKYKIYLHTGEGAVKISIYEFKKEFIELDKILEFYVEYKDTEIIYQLLSSIGLLVIDSVELTCEKSIVKFIEKFTKHKIAYKQVSYKRDNTKLVNV